MNEQPEPTGMPVVETVPCIVCRKPLEGYDFGGNQPSGATEFQTRGHYGSTVFDPMDLTFLAINICDQCLAKAGKDGVVLTGEVSITPPPTYKGKWDGR